MYSDVYYHKTTRGIEGLLELLFKRIKYLNQNNKLDLPLELQFMGGKTSMPPDLFYMDDNFIYSLILKYSKFEDDKILQDLSKRIINRKLFKVIEYPIGNKIIEIASAQDDIKSLISKKGMDPNYYYFMDEPQDRSYSPILSITNKEEKQKALEKNIYIKTDKSRCQEISQKSRIIQTLTNREKFTRIYIPENLREEAMAIFQNQ